MDLTGKEILPLDLTMAVAVEGRTDAHAAAVEEIARRLSEGKNVAMAVLGDVAVYALSLIHIFSDKPIQAK